MLMKATVGRIVHFYNAGMNVNGVQSGPFAAMITQVHGDNGCASMIVTPPFKEPYHEGSVTFWDGIGDPPGGEYGRYWRWPERV